MKCYLSCKWRIQKTEEAGIKQLESAVTSLDQGGDRDALLQQHDTAFCLPFRFNYHQHEGDQVKITDPLIETNGLVLTVLYCIILYFVYSRCAR